MSKACRRFSSWPDPFIRKALFGTNCEIDIAEVLYHINFVRPTAVSKIQKLALPLKNDDKR
jgi:hypothetical protein